MSDARTTRPPAVAGMFYEKSPSLLQETISELLDQARPPEIKKTVRAIISPHAGYVYSGLTAAYAFKLLENHSYESVILVGPSHREYFNGISIYPGDAYETPLGRVPVNPELRTQLLQEGENILASNAGHKTEHSLEVLLPFLQCVQQNVLIVPIVMGDQRRDLCEQLSGALVRCMLNRDILLIVSSDLSHFHPYDEAIALDTKVIQTVERFEIDNFKKGFEQNSLEACGGGPIAVAMETSWNLGAKNAVILHSCNSGDVMGEKKGVVGYFSAAFLER